MHTIIIGNGIAGVTAARFIRKLSDQKITIISAETDYFFSRTALMYVYMGHLRFEDTKPYEDWFWKKNRIDLLRARVHQIDTQNKQLRIDNEKTLKYDTLIIATGSTPNKFGWKGQDLRGVQGLYSYQDLQLLEQMSDQYLRQAVVVGGGLIGIELAEMLRSRGIQVSFLVRECSYWANVLPPEESQMVNRHIRKHHIDLKLNTQLQEILSDNNGRVRAVLTNTGEEIPCQLVGLTAGVRPNIDFIKQDNNNGIECASGILIDDFLRTNIADVYAIGDCAQLRQPQPNRKPIEAVWYVGRMMGETVAYTVCGQPQLYRPGIWFNSAKFLDIEYQVYGDVNNQHASVYWEHPDGEKSIRVCYDKNSRKVLGFNLMGIRYRQEVCEQWIKTGTDIKTVIQNLGKANFDPEFYKRYEKLLIVDC